MLKRSPIAVILVLVALIAVPSFGSPVPSKVVPNQSLAARDADLAFVKDFVAHEEVAKALAAHGFNQEQVNQRLAQLSPQDLHQLAQNLDQIQAAGLTKQEWSWIAIAAIAVIVLIIALS